jgi:hypothetical protein
MTEELRVTFFDIETGLRDLAMRREELAEQVGDPLLSDSERIALLEEMNGIDLAIAAYAKAEPQKVDSITDLIRHEEMLALAPAKRLAQLQELVDAHTRRAEWLRGLLMDGMKAAGKTEVDGINSRVKLVDNPEKVLVKQAHLVPPQFQKWTLTISGTEREEMLVTCESIAKIAQAAKPAEAAKSLIKPVLKRGEGVPGCVLDRGSRLVIE